MTIIEARVYIGPNAVIRADEIDDKSQVPKFWSPHATILRNGTKIGEVIFPIAFLNPSLVLSDIMFLSNSANAPMICIWSFPEEVVVSMF